MRKNSIKCLLLSLVACFMLAFGFACKKGGDTYTGFLAGAATKTPIAETVFMEDFIDYVDDGESKVVISQGNDSLDITSRWTPDTPGEFTITHTVTGGKNEGVYTHEILVTTPILMWTHSKEEINLLYNTEVSFEEIYKAMNLAVDAYYEWEPFMESVRINDVTTKFTDETSYKITSLDKHYFTYGVRAENGEEVKSVATANILFSYTADELYLGETTTGDYVIEQGNVQSFTINGETCEEATISAQGITIPKQVLRNEYCGTNFISMMTPSGEERVTLYVYTENYSFEGEYSTAPSFITIRPHNSDREDGTFRISNACTTDGANSLETRAPDSKWPRYFIELDYLNMVFEGVEVDAFAFEMTYAGATESHLYRDFTTNGIQGSIRLYRNVPQTITVTRESYEKILKNNEDYESKKADGTLGDDDVYLFGFLLHLSNSNNSVGGYDKYAKIYFDNFRAVRILPQEGILQSSATGETFDIEISGVTSIKIDGEPVPQSKYTITENQVSIDLAYLTAKVGLKTVEIRVNSTYYHKNISVYSALAYDFEDEPNVNSLGFIGWDNYAQNPTTTIGDMNGSKALRLYTQGGLWPQVKIKGDWLEMVFADEKNVAVAFDIMLDNCGKEAVTLRYFTSNVLSYTKLVTNEIQTLRIRRDTYEKKKAALVASGDLASGQALDVTIALMNQNVDDAEHPGGTSALALYFDNFRGETFQGQDFENATLADGTFIQTLKNTGITINRIIDTVDNNKSYAVVFGATSWPRPSFDAGWLESVFADTSVTGLQFSLSIVPNTQSTGYEYRKVSFANGAIATTSCYNGQTHTFTLTREAYQNWLNSSAYDEEIGFMITVENSANAVATQGGGSCVALRLRFDNFTPIRETEN